MKKSLSKRFSHITDTLRVGSYSTDIGTRHDYTILVNDETLNVSEAKLLVSRLKKIITRIKVHAI